MTKVDQFESQFRAAEREPFRYDPPRFNKILVVTDMEGQEASAWRDEIARFLSQLPMLDGSTKSRELILIQGNDFRTEKELLDLVDIHKPHLVATYRHLHSEGWRWHYSLGEHLDVLIGATKIPVLVLPHPKAETKAAHAQQDTNRVMVMTDHLTGAHALVNCGAALCQRQGKLFLSHLEDGATFEHYVRAIGKIPSIDTDNARARLREQLIKEPTDYIESCRTILAEKRPGIEVEALVDFGRRLKAYEALIEKLEIDLLIVNAKKEDQLAMRGLVYPLAVDLRHIPLVLI